MRIKLLSIFLILIISASFSSAITVNIDMKNSFELGDKIYFNYSINGAGEQINYFIIISCPNAPIPPLEMQYGTIPITDTYVYMGALDKSIEPQKCTAIVSIVSPKLSQAKNFTISANPSFSFDINSCTNQSCSEKKNIFVKGEDIYLSYNSDISDLVINAKLIFPNGKAQQINLPASIKSEKIGTYQLEITASKEGYNSQEKNLQFAVIQENANIELANLSENIGETQKVNWISSLFSKANIIDIILWGILIIAGLTILTILVIFIFQILKKKQ